MERCILTVYSQRIKRCALIVRKVDAGMRTLRVFHPTYGYWDHTVKIPSNDTLNSILNYKEVSPDTITVLSTPQTAEIIVDGIPTGRYTPSQIEMYPGRHIITVQKQGYVLDGYPAQIISQNHTNEPCRIFVNHSISLFYYHPTIF